MPISFMPNTQIFLNDIDHGIISALCHIQTFFKSQTLGVWCFTSQINMAAYFRHEMHH